MSSCVICGTSVDGAVCRSHEEDVVFEFRGDRPDQLVRNRYYRGEVDGFADFGVFVDIAADTDAAADVTGLLHESELDRRLDSLDWEEGDTVYVQVQQVHDNGNIDLGWSIRQSPREFRGELIHDPDIEGGTALAGSDDEGPADDRTDEGDGAGSGGDTDRDTHADEDSHADEESRAGDESATDDEEPAADHGADGAARTDEASAADDGTAATDEPDAGGAAESTTGGATDGEPAAGEAGHSEDAATPERVTASDLDGREGETVRVEGRIDDVRQTGGPTIFVVSDETGTVDCAAFETAGVRAYPELAVEDVVAVDGEVESHRGEIQIETAAIERLEGGAAAAVEERIEAAIDERAEPPETALLAPDPAVEAEHESVIAAATAIRRAVVESRPVILRHTATVDGYVAGAAIERAVLPLVREHHAAADAEYHYVDRRPLEEPFYDVGAATDDVTTMLEDADRHGENYPLFVLVDAGATGESVEGFELLSAYDAPRVVVDADAPAGDVAAAVDTLVASPETTSAVLAANVAAHVNAGVREEIRHLPAVSHWEDTPEAYADLAAAAGYDPETVGDLRAAVALEAYYQSYEDKREIVRDLLWGDTALAAHIADQFREKLETELRTATEHVERRDLEGGASLTLLDAAAFTHRFDFPPTTLLLDALHRQERESEGPPHVTVVVDETELRFRSTDPVDVREVGAGIADRQPDAGVRARGSADGRVEFLKGERVDVIDAAVAVIEDSLAVGRAASE